MTQPDHPIQPDRPAPSEALIVPLSPQPEPCPYLPGRASLFEHYLCLDCGEDAFCRLIEEGFRHFGNYFFRPDCPGPECPGSAASGHCGACLPLRVPVAGFRPSKTQRRVLRRGADLAVQFGPPQYSSEKFELYLKHKERFPETGEGSGAMAAESFERLFYAAFPFTRECVYTLEGRLVGAGLIDVAPRALSSIYFYFDPAFAGLSPGTLSILYEIGLARALAIPFYYLGYTVHANHSMRYKMDFRPCDFFDGAAWRPLRGERDFLEDPAAVRTGRFTRLACPGHDWVV